MQRTRLNFLKLIFTGSLQNILPSETHLFPRSIKTSCWDMNRRHLALKIESLNRWTTKIINLKWQAVRGELQKCFTRYCSPTQSIQ